MVGGRRKDGICSIVVWRSLLLICVYYSKFSPHPQPGEGGVSCQSIGQGLCSGVEDTVAPQRQPQERAIPAQRSAQLLSTNVTDRVIAEEVGEEGEGGRGGAR